MHKLPGGKAIQFLLLGDGGVLDELITVNEAMERLDVTAQRIRNMVSSGMLTQYPLDGRTYLLSRREVERYLASRKNTGKSRG